nr:hypothetical protein [Tanacetum cinerariifolium]
MANLSKDIQCAGSDTRPPMLDRSDFESWQQCICLYCLGKENGENILQSIDEGPFKMGKFRETLAEGALHLGYKTRWSLYRPYTKRKREMLLEGSELMKDERESQLYGDFEHFRQNKGETMHEYYVRFVTTVKLNRGLKTSNYDQLYAYLKQHEARANENKMMLKRYTQHAIDPLALMSNISPQQYPTQSSAILQSLYVPPGRQNRGQGNNARGAVAAGNERFQNRVENANPGGQTNMFDDDMDEAPVQHLALNEDNIFQPDQCDAFDFDVDEAPTTQTMFIVNLSSADPIYDEAMIQTFYLSNIIPYDQYVKNNAVQVVQSNVSFVPNDALMMIINDMHDQAAQCVFANEHNKVVNESLTAKLARYKEQVEIYEKRQEDTLEIVEKTRKKMLEKMKIPLCVEKRVKIAPPDYPKENYHATLTPQRHLIFWF